MVKSLDKVAEAGRKIGSNFVLGAGISLAALTFSPEEADGQDLGSHEMVCEKRVPGEGYVEVNDVGNYYYIKNPDGSQYYVQDELVSQGSDDCYYIDGTRAAPGPYVNGHPSIVVRGSGRAKSDSWLERNQGWLSTLAATAVYSIFQGSSEEENESKNSGPSINVESIKEGSNDNSYREDRASKYGNSPGKWENSEDTSSSWGTSEKNANVRNSQGERANKPEDNASKNSYEESSGKKEVVDDWFGGDATALKAHERRAKEFFGGYGIKAPNETLYDVGKYSRTSAYDLVSWVPYIGDAKEVYKEKFDAKKETSSVKYWRREILPDKINNSLDELDKEVHDYRESSTVDIDF